MKVGFVATRLAGTDGVSLEAHKWAEVARRLGHQVYACAGQLGPGMRNATLIPELHFQHPEAAAIGELAFGGPDSPPGLRRRVEAAGEDLAARLHAWLRETGVEVLIVENALAIPMHLPLGLALARLIRETGVPAIGHHHDFFWERARFRTSSLSELVRQTFPPDLPSLRHVTINSLARHDLRFYRGLDSRLVPNVLDFDSSPPGLDDHNRDWREAMGFSAYDWLFLQPTRIVARKGIELALELLHRLRESRARLVISHRAGDEGMAYYTRLLHLAEALNVDAHFLAGFVAEERSVCQGRKAYTLWDVYPHADLVTYPSLYEGFGNALLEAVYFRKPMLVNRYSVYAADIAPLGFRFVEVDGIITDQAVAQVRRVLDDRDLRQAVVDENYELARRHFSYDVLAGALTELLPA